MLIASTFLLWIVVALLVVAVVALARQIGVLHERIAPMGALVTDGGPKAGDLAPMIAAPGLAGGIVNVGGPDASGQASLLLFVAPDCPICKKIIPIAMVLARAEKLRLVFVGDGNAEDYAAMARRHRMEGFDFALSPQIGLAYQVGKLPTAALVSAAGSIVAKGLVNSREHLESLIVAGETGFASAQDYLRERGAAGDEKVVRMHAGGGK
ncbi:methylamine dehydrogenase accessory protein MauD [Sphingomonas fennica]|uniref:Methylamine utilization protein MauD n=1 Tax=Edaphosphingomonas fennica TaxID=114404 RepID=A0A2T4HNI9_9SPHN|nr:methylamine dehydrogenase accessory protein MauD [Sphingomonas fennica]PTD17337.1 methylamine dehydrogenase accessory protein MauD [Sphingomonas fennica]